MSKAAALRSIESAMLARLSSQCHDNGSIDPIASAICILCQVFGLKVGGLLSLTDEFGGDRVCGFLYRDKAYHSRCENAAIRRRMIIMTARTNRTSVARPVQ